MAHVRKITHPSGETAWRATVRTLEGGRRSKNFPRKGDADAWVRANDGVGATGSQSMTLLDLARSHNRWFEGLVAAGERGQITADGYDSHLRIHVQPDEIARTRLADLGAPMVQGLLDRIIARTGSVESARRVKRSVSAWAEHGIRNGWIKINPVEGTKVVTRRRRKVEDKVVIPPKADLVALLAAAQTGPHPHRDAAIVHLLMFTGLRISELLGAADDALDLRRNTGGQFHVTERLCSRHVTLGPVKSDEGLRSVPVGPATAQACRTWRAARGPALTALWRGERTVGRLFPGPDAQRHGPFFSYADFRRLVWNPLLIRAGLAEVVKTGAHKRVKVAFAPHTLRHVYASTQIANEVTPKRLQALLGHATLAMTMDLYGHLWTDDAGDQSLAAAAERAITN